LGLQQRFLQRIVVQVPITGFDHLQVSVADHLGTSNSVSPRINQKADCGMPQIVDGRDGIQTSSPSGRLERQASASPLVSNVLEVTMRGESRKATFHRFWVFSPRLVLTVYSWT
jgi:hypothetical protein